MKDLLLKYYDLTIMVLLFVGLYIILKIINYFKEKNFEKYIESRAFIGRSEKLDIKRDYDIVMKAQELLDFDFKVDSTTFYDLNLLDYIKRIDYSMSTMGASSLYVRTREARPILKDLDTLRYIRENQEETISLMAKFLSFGEIKNKELFTLLKNGIEAKFSFELYVKFYPLIATLVLGLFFVSKISFLTGITLILATNAIITKDISKKTQGASKMLTMLGKFSKLGIDVLKTDLELESIERLRDYKTLLKKINRKTGSFYNKVGLDTDIFYELISTVTLHEAMLFLSIKDLVNENKENLCKLYFILGDIDNEIALSNLYYNLDLVCKADVADKTEDISIEGEELHNPIIYLKDKEESVGNTFKFTKDILLTGSNASGKSTFLRTIGINHLMAKTLGFVVAKKFKTTDTDIFTSIDIKDSIEEKTSYFMAEAKTIKKMIDNPGNIYLLDEVFKGTNTIDRISAASSTLDYLSKQGFVVAATHDIELTNILEKDFCNYHFEEVVTKDEIKFDYKLKEGRAATRNAIRILEMYDYPEIITKKARERSEEI
ncbi:MutS domain V protein [Peptoniphilus sp. BV3AC2]|uniref:MutS-related protein n=1 Tax=Peptoniphilus sp. BV3AC2 TaxID=1111133 RepID=UPI0003B824DD|nr:MutS domain V protein [Peptoniphilus sp. BV3AC2]ERT63509.1 MutS domain V protein [Peptoniphilus sp. BV3AC2]